MRAIAGDSSTHRHWSVVQTAPNREPYVCLQLATYGLESYAPQFPAPGRTRPGSVRDRRRRWVFPGYVFFRLSRSAEVLQAIRWAPGVRRILTEEGSPAQIPEAVIGHLRKRISEAEVRDSGSGFKHGDAVVIEHGALAALDAIFDRDLDAPTRVQILVQVMNRTLPVRIDPAHLRPLAG